MFVFNSNATGGDGNGAVDDGNNYQDSSTGLPLLMTPTSTDDVILNDSPLTGSMSCNDLTDGGMNPISGAVITVYGTATGIRINGGGMYGQPTLQAVGCEFYSDPGSPINGSAGCLYAAGASYSGYVTDDGSGTISPYYLASFLQGLTWNGNLTHNALYVGLALVITGTATIVQLYSYGYDDAGGYAAISIGSALGGTIPAATDVRYGVAVGATTGSLVVPSAGYVDSTQTFDNGTHGTETYPPGADVVSTFGTFGINGDSETASYPVTPDATAVMAYAGGSLPNDAVLSSANANGTLDPDYVLVGAGGNATLPSSGAVLDTQTAYGIGGVGSHGTLSSSNVLTAGGGNYVVVTIGNVKNGVAFGPSSSLTGTYSGAGTTGEPMIPIASATVSVSAGSAATILQDVSTASNKIATLSLQVTAPAGATVSLQIGVRVAASGAIVVIHTLDLSNFVLTGQYPIPAGTTALFGSIPLPNAIDSVVVSATTTAAGAVNVTSSGSLA